MLRLLSLITISLVRVKSLEVCDDKYYLTTSGTAEYVDSFEQAQQKCRNSWLLEICDEKVVALLQNLKLDNQRILLGMTRNTNSWKWSNGITSHVIGDQQIKIVEVAYIINANGHFNYIAKRMSDYAGAICSKTLQRDNCTGWLHNGMCYFQLNAFYYTWFEAHNECIKYGAILAIFDNFETNFDPLKIGILSFFNNRNYWVSLSRNTWIWMRSGAITNNVVTFNKWAAGHPYTPPDPYSSPNCSTTDSSGNEWKLVNCSGSYHIVCMRENPGSTQQANNSTSTSVTPNIYEPSTQSLLPKPGGSSNFSEHATNEEPLSSGAKAGIGVGVSLLLIIIIIIIGVVLFKHSRRFKLKSQSEIKSQDIYEKPDFNTCQNHIYQGLETK